MSVRQTIIDKLTTRFEPTLIEVVDESQRHAGHAHHAGSAGWRQGGETHFRVRIATHHFDDLSRIAQHRLVMDTLDAEIKAGVHALRIEVVRA